MLKIKDEVDLKELEKFGFEKVNNPMTIYQFVFETKDRYEFLSVDKKNREIDGTAVNVLYDLIQAGLVEKVGE